MDKKKSLFPDRITAAGAARLKGREAKAEKPAAKKKEKAANIAKENEPLDDQLSFDSLGVSA